jgi:hypothetical protein
MSARREMAMEQFNQIIDVLQKSGKLGEDAAESQISFRYGHIPLSISAPYAMDRSFEAFEPALGFHKS